MANRNTLFVATLHRWARESSAVNMGVESWEAATPARQSGRQREMRSSWKLKRQSDTSTVTDQLMQKHYAAMTEYALPSEHALGAGAPDAATEVCVGCHMSLAGVRKGRIIGG